MSTPRCRTPAEAPIRKPILCGVRTPQILLDTASRIATHVARWAMKRVPPANRARIFRDLRCYGRLDYARAELSMTADSTPQFRRLHACRKEPETVAWIESSMRTGDVLYDIGANVGAYSLVACGYLSGDCRVYAFEPSFSNYAALNENVILNGMEGRVIPFNISLGASTQLVGFRYSSIEAGAALHNFGGEPERPFGGSSCVQTMLSYSLDEFIRTFQIDPPTHMKIDVDGAELAVVSGSPKALTDSSLRSVLIEIDDESPSAARVIGLINDAGLRVHARHPRGRSRSLANYVFERA
jgi:FkbM family methyltransferase